MPERASVGSGLLRSVCPICASPRDKLDPAHPDAWICSACAHIFASVVPPASELEELYKEYGYSSDVAVAPDLAATMRQAEVVRTFERHRRTGKLLDVGFGAGGLLSAAQSRGWKPYGVEISRSAVERAVENQVGAIWLGDLFDVPDDFTSFDVVVMTELIEHVPEPERLVARASELLRPGGLLYLTTPHGRGLSSRLLKSAWSVFSPPEHLQLFSKTSVRLLLERNGFSLESIEARGLHPHEVLGHIASRLGLRSGAARSSADARVASSSRLNARLMSTRTGRLLKRAANLALHASELGDGLEVHATSRRREAAL